MPFLKRPLLPGLMSPEFKKRRISFEEDTMFPYPTLPDDCVNNDHGNDSVAGLGQELRPMLLVPRTDSIEWGDKAVAEKRSLIEPKVTQSNQRLFRTNHPSLGHHGTVYLVEESQDKWIWVVSLGLDTATSISTHAGNLEIHLEPAGFTERTTTIWPKYQPDPIGTLIPRKFLSRKHLHRLREMFPTSLGARVLISGCIVILFKSRSEIENSWQNDGWAGTFGALRITYDVLEDTPTQEFVSRGAAITRKAQSFEAFAALGLKLRFQDGREAITVPTHAFINLRVISSAPLLRIADWYRRIKGKLARYSFIKSGSSLPAIGSSRNQPMGNSPLGKEVFLAGGAEMIGTISFTYDPIADKPLRFPIGFTHDLSLVTRSPQLPEITTPDNTPHVVGWGDYKEVLDGKPVFVTGFSVRRGRQWELSGSGLSREAQAALTVGSQYLWDREIVSQNVSILWRTERDRDRLGGFSGSALCLGKLLDRTCLAICFQNFETPVHSRELLNEDHRGAPESATGVMIKGGFLLPLEVRNAQIICNPPEGPWLPGTYPSRSNSAGGLRRSLSSTC